jgi:hypothetical protein
MIARTITCPLLFFVLVLLGFDIDDRLGNSGEGFVRVLFFLERRIEKLNRFLIAKLFGPCGQGAVARNLVVLHGLRGSKKACIEGGHSLEVLHDLGPLFRNAIDRRAGFAPRGLADDFEHAVKALYLAFGLTLMLDEGRPELLRLRGFGHLRQSLQDLVFGEVDVFQRFMKKIFKLLRFLSHGVLP